VFEDEVLDMQAEIDGLQVRMQTYNCLIRFKQYASEEFVRFNSRQIQNLIYERFSREMDIDYLEENRIILDHFFQHNREDRDEIQQSWDDYKWRLI
jgi:hypothetical protein